MIKNKFIHLKVHSAYSLAEGAIRIPDLLDFCIKNNIPACALTDTGNLFGAMEFCLNATKSGVQPIIGVKIILQEENAAQSVNIESNNAHTLTLLAKSELGYKNLIKIVSKSYLEPDNNVGDICTNFDNLKLYNQDVIALTGGRNGAIAQYFINNQPELSYEYCKKLQEIYQEDLYIEIERLGHPDEAKCEKQLVDLAYKNNIPLVATNESFFINEDQYEAHDALICIARGNYVQQIDRYRVSKECRLKTPQEMCELFHDLPEAINNTLLIAQKCNFMLEVSKPVFPTFNTPKGEDNELKHQAIDGLKQRLEQQVFTVDMDLEKKAKIQQQYTARLEYEIDTIHKMGYSGYFLIVAEFIQWSKANNIPVGPGRGSGAGSLVSWCLTITNVNPIEFNLIFERFLNPERVSMPDFDIDFCPERRDEVIQHVCDMYGKDKVAQIITFGKLQAKAVVRDVGRVLGMPYGQVDRISKLIPSNPTNPVTLPQAIQQEIELQTLSKDDPEIKKLLDIAMQLEGLYRHASTHAAGIVIGNESLDNIVALYQDPKSDLPATQFSMKFVELIGLVKFDFLGLKTLTIIQKTIELITEGKLIEIDIDDIPLDDDKAFQLLRNIETVGIFQLESPGMKDVLRKLQPTKFEEIIALVALYRPGPMDDIPRYIACKNGTQEAQYEHSMLEGILQETYGVMVYQEQVMQIAQQLAGYSLGQADLLRRAMGKKIKAEMDSQRDIFISGCQQHNNISQTIATKIFDAMAKFASYGFNKCHSAPYGLIAYQTSYLKANYPVEFIASMMTYDMQNTDKLSVIREELNRLNIPLLAPDINKSTEEFTVEKIEQGYGVRYALCALKNVGESAIKQIVEERKENGEFQDIIDFVRRIDNRSINKRMMENLISAGAFDSLEINRAKLYNSIEIISKYVGEVKAQAISMQNSLFGGDSVLGLPEVKLNECRKWNQFEIAQREFDAIGFYFSKHPVEPYSDILSKHKVKYFSSISNSIIIDQEQSVTLAGVIVNKKEKLSKRGKKYAFVQFSDQLGLFEGVLFSETLSNNRELLETGSVVLINGIVKNDNGEVRLLVNSLQSLEEYAANMSDKLRLKIKDISALNQLRDLLSTIDSGATSLSLVLHDGSYESLINLKQKYKITPKIREEISTIHAIEEVIGY